MFVRFFVFSILCIGQVYAQQNYKFPDDIVGSWKGNLEWKRPGMVAQKFSMQLIIAPVTDSGYFTYNIIYGENKADNRPYLLKPVDTLKGKWMVDERNGILLYDQWISPCLSGIFTVQGNTIFNDFCFINKNQLQVKFYSINLENKQSSGLGTNESPTVTNYQINTLQIGILEKQSPKNKGQQKIKSGKIK